MKNMFIKLKDERGQSAVEFALVGIVLLLLVFGIVEFGRAWFRADTLKGAANIAARTYAVTSGDKATKENAARTAADGVETGMGLNLTFPGAVPATSVTVTASEPFASAVPGLLPMLGSITLTRTATYRME